MYINCFTRIIYFIIVYVIQKKSGVKRILQLSQRNGKLPLTRKKQGYYPVISICGDPVTYRKTTTPSVNMGRYHPNTGFLPRDTIQVPSKHIMVGKLQDNNNI